MIEIVPLERVDPAHVEALLDAAFGADRKARTAYRMREGVCAVPALSFAARDGDRLVGTLQSWPVALEGTDGRKTSMTLVGPVAVMPEIQRAGLGRKLMEALVAAAAEQGHDALVMIGDPEYYGRFFDFTADATADWIVPGPVERRRLLARISRPGGVPAEGRLIPDPGFASGRIAA
ncbi:MAG: N-acetyltransferase [Sphingomonadales bacterium]|nr:N-acetyltransferase [Sphingomonadales bacterium]